MVAVGVPGSLQLEEYHHGGDHHPIPRGLYFPHHQLPDGAAPIPLARQRGIPQRIHPRNQAQSSLKKRRGETSHPCNLATSSPCCSYRGDPRPFSCALAHPISAPTPLRHLTR